MKTNRFLLWRASRSGSGGQIAQARRHHRNRSERSCHLRLVGRRTSGALAGQQVDTDAQYGHHRQKGGAWSDKLRRPCNCARRLRCSSHRSAQSRSHPTLPTRCRTTRRDLIPVVRAVTAPLVLVTATGSRFNKLSDLVSFAKANPGKVTFASAGIGCTKRCGSS
jgi:hypothetical protein